MVKLYDILEPEDPQNFQTIYLVFEAVASDLRKVQQGQHFLTTRHVKTIMYNLLCGLKYIHSANVIHRDLKPANVLVSLDCTAKICDFGLARQLTGIQTLEPILKGYFEEMGMESPSKKERFSLASSPSKLTEQTSENKTTKPAFKISSNFEELKVESKREKFMGLLKDHVKKLSGELEIQRAPLDVMSDDSNKIEFSEMNRNQIAEALQNTRDERRQLDRQLTSHVATRFYRAPELILMEKDYGKPVDIWSAGVIFGELLHTLEENSEQKNKGRCLFPGKYCFPLSPNRKAKLDEDGIPENNDKDQMQRIFDLIGSPTEEDMSFISDDIALKYIKKFKEQDSADLSLLYPGSEQSGLDLLKQMLQFNPYFRPTVEQCLESPYFDEVRQFGVPYDALNEVDLKFEQMEGYLSLKDLRQLFLHEIENYANLKH